MRLFGKKKTYYYRFTENPQFGGFYGAVVMNYEGKTQVMTPLCFRTKTEVVNILEDTIDGNLVEVTKNGQQVSY